MNPSDLQKTHCVLCACGRDQELYPARLRSASFTPYAFSARRNRVREHYRLVRCTGCGLVRSDPVLPEGTLNTLYTESAFLFSKEEPYAAAAYERLLKNILERHIPNGVESLLEIGSSTGFFLERARQMGIRQLCGFEPSADCVALAPSTIRPSIIQSPFALAHIPDQKFDLACGMHVVDHLPDPVTVFTEVAQCLRSRGHLLLVCHDVGSLSVKLLGGHNPIFDVEHIYLFSQKTIALLLDKCGFEPLAIGSLPNTYPLGYWMRLTPGVRHLVDWLPDGLTRIPVTLHAGNLYALGRKKG
ncbi:MAG: class I SAM-dependent methyltransferase [Magnetococcales bacterium]|nr:class I SAM-dependent methyltransferase [Magnetococcales bacterium]NGZ06018.1 class I SAM-dependent methyltransferase [Magnetococcales bacterium]